MDTPVELEPKEIEQPRLFCVAFDDSPEARCAVEHAASLARAGHEDCLLIVTVVRSASEREEAEKILGGAKALSFLYNKLIVTNTLVVVADDYARAFCETARNCQADYIVVGCRGSNFTRKFLGSTSKKITKLAHCPVLLCRPNAIKKGHHSQSSASSASN